MHTKAFKNGFSLVEILIVLAIIGVLSAIFTLSFSKFRSAQILKNSMDSTLSLLYEARSNTISGLNNSQYSVRFESGQAILFKGTSYNSADATNKINVYDTGVTASSIALSGSATQISFAQLSGTASANGTITLSGPNSTTKIITIDASGSISHN